MESEKKVTAEMILGNPDYPAISYGGYRDTTRSIQPTLDELKDDMRILSAMGIKVIRTYNLQLAQAPNILKVISELKKEDPEFELYVMLGAWIDCKNAWTDLEPDHNVESAENAAEIGRAVALANQYPDIVKIIAVGNEAMVKWAASYFVQPDVILKWVKHLQGLKAAGELPKELWITSSDNFASWGGGSSEYHVDALNQLFSEVDFVSLHTYPMHDTHYNPVFWGTREEDEGLSDEDKIKASMARSIEYAQEQFASVKTYMNSLGINKPMHIGETGWASFDADNRHYGKKGSKASDEYKEAVYHELMREWTNAEGISCFFFEAFDEPWKDAHHPGGSENHFGLFKVDGRAKYAMWPLVDAGVFDGLTRNGNPITKTYNGNLEELMKDVLIPSLPHEIATTN
ncbi:MAG: glycosyl hydrolase family 17 protein [Cyclobacteriaceae bacterium]